MAGIKISNLPAIPSSAFTDVGPFVQSSVTYQATLLQIATLFGFNSSTHLLGMSAGGTNANLTASLGAIPYSTASAFAFLAPGTSGQFLQSQGAASPIWSATTFPTTAGATGSVLISDGTNWISSTSHWPNTVGTTGKILRSNGTSNVYTTSTFADTYSVSTILYASSANTVSGLATANSATLVTSAGGVPSLSTTLPTGMMIADPTTDFEIANKHYVDQIALSGTSVYAATLPTSMLDVVQAGAGVGATLTNNGILTTFSLDGVNPPLGSNVLIKDIDAGGTAANFGIYTVSDAGSGASPWILTRATTYDTPTKINNTGLIVVQNGSTLAGSTWYNTEIVVTVDTTDLNYVSFDIGKTLTVATQIFTSSGTYTPAAGMAYCIIECVGGGGGSGGSTAGVGTPGVSGGGGGGGYSRATKTAAQVGASQVVTIGAAGTAGGSGTSPGGNGGTTSVGALCSATGGDGSVGGVGTASITVTPGGKAGTSVLGDFGTTGSDGGYGLQLSASVSVGGVGGSSVLGGGVQNSAQQASGIAGYNFGGGAAGCNPANADATGAVGFAGIVIITEYILV